MEIIRNIRAKVRFKWWHFRHEVYYYAIPVAPPIHPPSGEDDSATALIQNAINEAGRTPDWFTDIYVAYEHKWYRFFLKKPVLKASVQLQPGTYVIGSLTIGGNATIVGYGMDNTVLKRAE